MISAISSDNLADFVRRETASCPPASRLPLWQRRKMRFIEDFNGFAIHPSEIIEKFVFFLELCYLCPVKSRCCDLEREKDMAGKKLRFALFGKAFQDDKSTAIRRILDSLREREAEVYVHRAFYDYLTKVLNMEIGADGVFDGYDVEVDYALSIGGDGTFLKAASLVGSRQTPIMGVNTGRLGFLADVLPAEVGQALGEIYEGRVRIEGHTMIRLETDGEPIESNPCALNDIAVLKRDMASMISIRACVNGEYLVTYQADGLIVSTPTGSTAYNLSNGGPIMVPSDRNLCITPVAPHSLNIRPIVVRDDARIELEVESRSHNFLVAIDGRSEKLVEGTRLTVSKAPYEVKMVKRLNQRYFSTLREKMMWGADQR